MISDKLSPHLEKLFLALIFLVLSASTIAWTLADQTPPAWDPADHISAGYDYYSKLANLDFNGFWRALFVEPRYYAPLAHLVTAAVFLVFGASRLTAIGVNLISLAVMLASIAWMGRMLYSGVGSQWSGSHRAGVRNGKRKAENDEPSDAHRLPFSVCYPGILAALLANCYHFTAWLMHDAFLDYPLTAIVTASFAFLIRAGDFTERRPAVMFGIAAGLGILTKQTFPFFFALPALYVTGRVLLSRNRQAIINLLIAGAVALAIAAIWYGPHFNDVLEIYRVNREAAISENEAPLYGFVSNVYYTFGLLSFQMQLPFGILFICGTIYSLIRRRKESIILYLWLISGIATFTLIANKEMRYTVPVLPAAALLSVCWLADFRLRSGKKEPERSDDSKPSLLARMPAIVRALKAVLASAIVIWAFVSFFNAQWPGEGNGYSIDFPRFRWMVFYRNYYGFDHRPLPEDWGVPDIVRAVAQHNARAVGPTENPVPSTARPPTPRETVSPPTHEFGKADETQRPTLGVVVNLPFINPSNVALYARLMARERAGPPLIKVDWMVLESARDRVGGCEYLLVRTGLDQSQWVAPIERYAEDLIWRNPMKFSRVASFPIPLEDAEAVIYRCEP